METWDCMMSIELDRFQIPFDQANSKGWAVHASYSTLVTFSAGICFMSLYYRNFHPRGQLPDNGKKASLF